MRRLARNLLRGVLILAVLFGTVALARAVVALGGGVARSALPSGLGVLAAVALFCLGYRGPWLYVFGHEFTHWLAAKAFRRRTSSFRVGLRGGSVSVERPNLFIVLCPYFVPLYSLVWLGLYGVYLLFVPAPPPWAGIVFQAGLGATYGFHLAFTVWTLRAGQKDLLVFGPWFSLSVILFGNTLVLFLATVIASRQWAAGFGLFGTYLKSQSQLVARGVSGLCSLLVALASRLRGST